jgi:hypothetical protein
MVASLVAGIIIGTALMLLIFDLSHIPAVNTGFSEITLGDLWSQWHPDSLHGLREAVQSHAPQQMWDPGFLMVLRLPVWLILCLLGIGIYGGTSRFVR